MSLINCPECNKEISDKAVNCPYCGNPMQNKKVIIKFPILQGQLFNNECYVYNKKDNKVLAKGIQGDTVEFECIEPITIIVKVGGCFGKPEAIVNPGDKLDIRIRGFGSIYISKVDTII